MKTKLTLSLAAMACVYASWASAETAADMAKVERGRYLIKIAACNDCHTPHYMENDGTTDSSLWLTGTKVGFQGPWGTTYPVNLRLYFQTITEEQWIKRARTAMRPPMPWFNLRDMAEEDLSALYHYVRYMGPAGEPAPAFVPPGKAARYPYFDFTPKNLPKKQARK